MHVPYDEFKGLGLADISEDEYARLAPLADAFVDRLTLGRVGRSVKAGDELPDVVVAVYCATIDALPPIIEEAGQGRGGLVTSFSNGIDSYTFDASEGLEGRLMGAVGWMADLLPIEWVSAVAGWEGGSRYAG